MPFSRFAMALAVVLAMFADSSVHKPGGLTVHEWGTFTSIAGPEGNAIDWLPFSGTPDLPCFVHRLTERSVKSTIHSLVRMETPVLYFYAPAAMRLSVHVSFPLGLLTEWYPQATRVEPRTLDAAQAGRLEWDGVRVSPGEPLEFPAEKPASHYYAARETDAAPLQVGPEREKMLFYRGVGNFQVPVTAKFVAPGKLEIGITGVAPISEAVLFERRGDRMGYRVIRGPAGKATLETPELTGDRQTLRAELDGALEGMGLYPKEAQAMLATWGDSWLEEGMRVFYLMPRQMVDTVLPLEVSPAPRETARAFVGRVEMLSPAMRDSLETALANGDVDALKRYGRFLPRFSDLIREQHGGRLNAAPAAAEFLRAESAAAAPAPSCAQ